jgi:hypothetical protein
VSKKILMAIWLACGWLLLLITVITPTRAAIVFGDLGLGLLVSAVFLRGGGPGEQQIPRD